MSSLIYACQPGPLEAESYVYDGYTGRQVQGNTADVLDCQHVHKTQLWSMASLQPGCMVPQCCQMQSRKSFGGSLRPRQVCCRFEAKPLKVRSLRTVPSRIACEDFGSNNSNLLGMHSAFGRASSILGHISETKPPRVTAIVTFISALKKPYQQHAEPRTHQFGRVEGPRKPET